jgi:drug/metabolite transporter (DMT)-like permease
VFSVVKNEGKMRRADWVGLFVLAAIWGASFLFIRVAAHDFGPIFMAACRVSIAALTLLSFALIAHHRFDWQGKYKEYLFLGLFNAVFPFILLAFAELSMTAALTAIITAVIPIFTALTSAIVLSEKLTPPRIMGLFLGLVGVTIVAGWNPLTPSLELFIAIGAALLTCLCYGVAGVYAKVKFQGTPALTLATGQQIAGTFVLLPFGLFSLPPKIPAAESILSVILLGMVSTGIAYIIFFTLLAKLGPTKNSTVTFLVPVFGILWGALFLGEEIGVGLVVGFGVILASLFLMLRSK